MIYLASDSGLRPQEYLALPTADLLERGIRVTQAVSRSNRIQVPKSPAARRYLPVSTDVLGMTRHYVERHEGPNLSGLVYPGEHGGHQQYGHFSKRCWRTLMKEAGLVQEEEIDGEKRLENIYTPYSLRHFYASMPPIPDLPVLAAEREGSTPSRPSYPRQPLVASPKNGHSGQKFWRAGGPAHVSSSSSVFTSLRSGVPNALGNQPQTGMSHGLRCAALGRRRSRAGLKAARSSQILASCRRATPSRC